MKAIDMKRVFLMTNDSTYFYSPGTSMFNIIVLWISRVLNGQSSRTRHVFPTGYRDQPCDPI